jgi:hypothetical protein
MKRIMTTGAAALLALALTAGPAAAKGGPPNVECLRAGVSALQGAPEFRLQLAQDGVLGAVIKDHLSEDADYPWC